MTARNPGPDSSGRGRGRRGETRGPALTSDGVVVLDKPQGPTSMRLVEQVRALVQHRKAGHAGTLDPAASGVLPICLGAATRLSPYLMDGDKEYVAGVRLGVETTTFDLEGEVVARREVPALQIGEVERHLEAFTGLIVQRPPAFSALRSQGERLYERARRGEVVEVPPRTVEVRAIEVLRFAPPFLELRVTCGKGTYLRSLASDLGRALGCGACLEALRRTLVGRLELRHAVTPAGLAELAEAGSLESIVISPADALGHLPAARLSRSGVARLRHGQVVGPEEVVESLPSADGGPLRVLDLDGRLVAIGQAVEGGLRARRVIAAEPDGQAERA